MAVTKGHGNPRWNREETLLALNLYFEFNREIPSASDPRIVELSGYLRHLPYHSVARRKETFRNIAGVNFKLQNIRNALTGRGLSNISKMDRDISEEFGDRPDEVARLVKVIRSTVKLLETDDFELMDDFEEEFYEGKSVFVAHRKIERSRKLRQSVLKSRGDHQLVCDICNFGRPYLDRSLQEAFFEVHHLIPLANLVEERATTVADISLLCASCHRGIHKLMSIKKTNVTIEDAKNALGI